MIYLIVAGCLLAVLVVLLVAQEEKSRKKFIASLNESEEYDIVQLWKKRAVRPHATGQDIRRINAEIKNCTDKNLHVLIKPGTYFLSSGQHQNMVVREEYRFRLEAHSTKTIQTPATCINAHRPIPGKQDRFDGVASVSENVQRFLQKAQHEDDMVIQAGVWALTDGMNGYQVQNHLFYETQHGTRRAAITEEHVKRAKKILNELGIVNGL